MKRIKCLLAEIFLNELIFRYVSERIIIKHLNKYHPSLHYSIGELALLSDYQIATLTKRIIESNMLG